MLAIIFGISSLVLVASSLLIKNPIYENKPVFWSMFILGVIISIIFLSLGSAFDFFETSSEVITYMNPINRKELEVLLKKQEDYIESGYFEQFKTIKNEFITQKQKNSKRNALK